MESGEFQVFPVGAGCSAGSRRANEVRPHRKEYTGNRDGGKGFLQRMTRMNADGIERGMFIPGPTRPC